MDTQKVESIFGERLKITRKGKGLRQVDLAKLLAVSVDTITRWENNLREPRASELEKIAEALDTSVTYLLGGNEKAYYEDYPANPTQEDKSGQKRTEADNKGVLSVRENSSDKFDIVEVKTLSEDEEINACLRQGWKYIQRVGDFAVRLGRPANISPNSGDSLPIRNQTGEAASVEGSGE
jgi:transcriptional regulator with XRE-family HTH domain